MNPETLLKRLARAEARAASLERLIEDKSRELYIAAERLEEVFQATPVALFVCDDRLLITRTNQPSEVLLGVDSLHMVGRELASVLGVPDLLDRMSRAAASDQVASESVATSGAPRLEITCRPEKGPPFPVVVTLSRSEGRVVVACRDVRREKQLELELRHAQKLEAVGQLAAGVAHEINTPIQFVGDSLYFLREAFVDLIKVAEGTATPEEADLGYLVENVPGALSRCEDGIARVTQIVRALKELSHPDAKEKAPADLNRAVENALVVARSEIKHVADVEVALGALPNVECHLGDVGQLLLNLLVNGAHAIEERIERDPVRGKRGHLVVRTSHEGSHVRLDVIDDGAGIPEAIKDRLFEPFFTTKPVGRGTGQGLSIARSIVVDRHGGELSFESEVGVGTTFHVRLPVRATESVRRSRDPRASA